MGCAEGRCPSAGSLRVSLSCKFYPLPGQEGDQGDGRLPEADQQHPASSLAITGHGEFERGGSISPPGLSGDSSGQVLRLRRKGGRVGVQKVPADNEVSKTTMSEVFYRKWRPQRLDQVVGQEPVTQTLRQAVSLGRVAHAYLFCGPRGTGKTSTARILAKAVNCLSPQDGEPDNECEICLSINEGRALDLIEIDAASNRGIDDIRNISDKVRFSPSEARYKLYIIDEVHMLTEHAFNALLKTLEEPPQHAIFVLATTEPHKVPLTIISRCQRFDFRRIPLESTLGKLEELCKDEEIEAATEALRLIARTSSGSLRDAENLLEQVVISYGSPLTEQHVRDLQQLGGDESALDLVGHIINREAPKGLIVINQVAAQGSDLRQLHRGVMEFLRALLLIKTNAGSSLGHSKETMSQLNPLAEATSIEYLVLALKTFSRVDLRQDSGLPLPLELALVESCTEQLPTPAPQQQPAAVAQKTPVPYDRAAGRSTPRTTTAPGPKEPSQGGSKAPCPSTAYLTRRTRGPTLGARRQAGEPVA